MVDGCLALSGCHGSVKHNGRDTSATETPFNQLEHGCELREDNGFAGHVLGAKLIQIVDKGLNLGAGSPVLHLDPIDDGGFLHHLFVLFHFRLLKVDAEGNMALWAIRGI